jgi:hypothetical protein
MTTPDVMPTLFKECIAENPTPITNCAYMGMSSAGNYVCYACESGFVLDSAGTACVTWTNDTTCMQTDSTKAYCTKCWWPYWFFEKACMAGDLNQVNLVFLAIVTILLLINGGW